MLRGLFESRVATLKQVADLYCDGRTEAAKRRMRALRGASLIRERPRRRYHPSILFLGKRGFETLQTGGLLADYPTIGWSSFEKRAHVSELTLKHELQVMDVKAAFCRAVAGTSHLRVAEFSTWPRLYQFRARLPSAGARSKPTIVKPDGFIRVREEEPDGGASERLFYLEVDRGTEKLATLARKALLYLDHYRSGGLAERFGDSPDAYREYPFRVLLLCRSRKRVENIARRLLANSPPTLRQVWLGMTEEVLADPLGAEWTVPIDFKEGGAADPGPRRLLD